LKPYPDALVDGVMLQPGLQINTRSAFVDRDSVSDAIQILTEVAELQRPPFISIRSVGAAVSRVPGGATAFAHRTAELMIVTTVVGPELVVEAGGSALEVIWRRLAPHVNGAYANYLSSATVEDVAAVYPGQTYRRLAAVKRQYDPGNLFAQNHNIRPR
jgi:hypothetical protein